MKPFDSYRRNEGKRKNLYLKKERRGFCGDASIPDDLRDYFLGLANVKLEDFTSDEEKEIFVDNVLDQTVGKETIITCSDIGSRVLEKFLPLAKETVLLRFMNDMSKELCKICTNQNGSFVLQKMIVIVSAHLPKEIEVQPPSKKELQTISPENLVKFENWFSEVCSLLLTNFKEFSWNRSANIVIRTVLECMSGLPFNFIFENKRERKYKVEDELKEPPIKNGRKIIKKFVKHFLTLPYISNYVCSPLTSGLLQTILHSSRRVGSITDELIYRLLSCYTSKSDNDEKAEGLNKCFQEIFACSSAAFLMDAMISTSSDEMFSVIYSDCFVNKLKPMSLSVGVNFCVQNLINRCSKKCQFEPIFDELSSNFEALFCQERHGVLLALCETCLRLGKQGDFIKELQSVLHCDKPERQDVFPLLLAYFVNYESWCESSNQDHKRFPLNVTLHGSLLLQTLLNFQETIKIVKAILNTETQRLKTLLCDKNGSYIVEAFFNSKTIGEKSKNKLCFKLKAIFVPLAVSKIGSRVLDKIWDWASLTNRRLILEELAPRESMLRSDQYGCYFVQKTELSLFIRRPNVWQQAQSQGSNFKAKKRKLLSDIIDT